MNKLMIAFGAMLLPLVAQAEDLLSLYERAAKTDPVILAAQANRDATRLAEPLAKAALLPNVSLQGDLTYNDRNVKGGTGDEFSSNNLSLNLVQPLFRKDRWVSLDRARDEVKQSEADYRAAEQALMLRVAQAYFGVLSAKENLVFAQAEKKAIARQLEQAKERFEVGLVAITDVHEAQARFDQANANEITARNAVDNAMESLRQIVADASTKLADLKERLPLVPPDPADLDEWSRLAERNNPTLQSARLAAELARKNIELQRAGHYPTLDLVGGISRTRTGATGGTDLDNKSIGLQLALPIYSGGAVVTGTEQAARQFTAAQENLDASRREVVRQVRDAYRAIQTAISRVAALKASVKSALSALDATEAGFEA
ncbi:MAG: hypothetical protein D6720_12155, partial [Gammaproteobacteria bacterium]